MHPLPFLLPLISAGPTDFSTESPTGVAYGGKRLRRDFAKVLAGLSTGIFAGIQAGSGRPAVLTLRP